MNDRNRQRGSSGIEELLGGLFARMAGRQEEEHVHDENCIPDEVLKKIPFDRVQMAKNTQRLLTEQASQLGDLLVVTAMFEEIQSTLNKKLENAKDRAESAEDEGNEEREGLRTRVENLETMVESRNTRVRELSNEVADHEATIRRLRLELEDAKKLVAPLPTVDEENGIAQGASNVS